MLNRILSKFSMNKSVLTMSERQFISSFATDFIDSYRVGNNIVVDEWDDEEELTKEIGICKNLIKKFGTNERKEYLNFEITK